ncbi:MAG: DNA polymerase I [Dehalococcoidia bacterium]|nr:DNA polymerase I [Dehalococcoidia bacterium]
MSKEKPLLILFDGNALVHRAFHALPPLSINKTGEMVNAVQGFASTLLKLLRENKPDYWAIAFDRAAPTFRHEMFEDYKAQRPKTPPELVTQIERVHQLAGAFNLPVFEKDGFEADDLIGTISTQAGAEGIDTLIVTGDNDMLQMVKPGIRVMSPRRGFADTVVYDTPAVKEKYGLEPAQLISYKALVGDASDNIPGVKGIGDKTAVKLLQQFKDLEGIYSHIDQVEPERIRNLLRESHEAALQNQKLAAIVTDVPVAFNIDDCRVSSYDRNSVVELFRELGFSAMLSRLPDEIGEAPAPAAAPRQEPAGAACIIADSAQKLDELALRLSYAGTFAVSVTPGGDNPMQSGLVGIAVSPARGESYYIPIGHMTLDRIGQLPLKAIVKALGTYITQERYAKIVYDGKFDIILLAQNGLKMGGVNFDVLIAAYLLGEKSLKLKSLAFNRLGIEARELSDLTGSGAKQVSPARLAIEQVGEMGCSDSDITLRLKESLEQELRNEELWSLFNDVEMPLVPLLAEMEMNGVLLDRALLNEMSSSLGADMQRLEKDIYSAVGHQFNINSPQQLSGVLFTELKLQPVQAKRKTQSGLSTDAATLEELKDAHPVIKFILEYRTLSKLKSTYTDALPMLINPGTGRVHTSFNQTGTTTGRLSSSEPNLQNLPVRGEIGSRIRQSIIAQPGWLLLSADYSQIDLRALAHLSQDKELIDTFLRDEDIHTHTASEVFGVPDSEVTPRMRRAAKTINFGVIYGMSGYGLQQATDLSREEAELFISTYFKRYPGVKNYLEATKRQAAALGYVQTVLGRRRFIPEINSTNRLARESAERMAINMPVQGTSADIIKIAMVNLHREMKKRGMKTMMILQVHDELVFEAPPDELETIKQLVLDIMPGAMKLVVPLKIDIKVGQNWGEMT